MDRKLTDKQERFARNIVAGMSQVDAYCVAYGVNKNELAINGRAQSLYRQIHVQNRIADLKDPVVLKAQISLQDHINSLVRLRDASVGLEQMSAAIKAEENIGKVLGFYIIKTEISGSLALEKMDDAELDRKIAEKLALLGAK